MVAPVLMPTRPAELMRRRSALLVLNASVFEAGRYMPSPATTLPVGTNLVALAVPVVAKLVPLKVSAVPVVSTRLALR